MEDSRFFNLHRILTILWGVWLVVLPITSLCFCGIFKRELSLFPTAILALLTIIIVLTKTTLSRHSQQYTISKIDIALSAFCLYALLRGTHTDPLSLLYWGAAILTYIAIRQTKNKTIILNALVLSATVQSIIAIAQKIGYIASQHSLFDVTGSLGNPGQLGGYLAIGFVISITLLKTQKHKLIYLVTLCVIAIGLYLADSRASYVAVVIGIIVLCADIILLSTKKYWKYLIPLCIVIVAVVSILTYNYRPDSADSRLLVWRVTMDMIADKPLIGGGLGSFEREYMLCQASYLTENPNSKFAMVADNVAYPYNELIHITVELGIIGLLLALSILWIVFKRKHNRKIKASIAGLVVFSMFSYPSYVFALLTLLFVLLGLLSNDKSFRINLPRWTSPIIISAFIGIGVFYVIQGRCFWHLTPKSQFEKVNIKRLKANPQYSHNLIVYWANNTSEFDEGAVDYIIPSAENYCDLGDIYAKKGDYSKSEEYYLLASQMIPTRVKPNYKLWQLYVNTQDSTSALHIANKLLSQPLKIENTFTIRSKAEVSNWLEINN